MTVRMVLVFRLCSQVNAVKSKAAGYYINNTFCSIRKDRIGIGNKISGKFSKHEHDADA
ncbi:hypothetical protein D3C73_1593570 [compost metagenome]